MKWIRVLVLPALLIIACDRTGPQQRQPVEIETVDVDAGYDANLSIEADERAKQSQVDMGGVLPADFPSDMPVFSPSNIVDFGPGFVEIDTPVSAAEVRSSLDTQIQRSGWAVQSIGEGSHTYGRNGRQVRVRLTTMGSGTRIRYEY